MFTFKRIALSFLLIFTVFCLLIPGMIVYLDPLHIYHMPTGDDITLDDNARHQDAAFISFFDFDSIILGNSHMENTSASEAGEILGGKFVNLSLSGSGNHDRMIVLKDVFRRHKIKTAVLLLTNRIDIFGHGGYATSNWDFLYDENPFNDITVYFNDRYANYMVRCVFTGNCEYGTKRNLDRPYEWLNAGDHMSRIGGLSNWGKYHDNDQLKDVVHDELPTMMTVPPQALELPDAEKRKIIDDFLEETVFSFVREHPETTFYCYYCPRSMLRFALESREGKLGEYDYYVLSTVRQGDKFENFKFFGFDTLPFTSDLSRYKDLDHFDPQLNSELLVKLKNNEDRVNSQNVEAYLAELRKRADSFDIKQVYDTIQRAIPVQ